MAAVASVVGAHLTSLPDKESQAWRHGLKAGVDTLHECDVLAEQLADDDRDDWRVAPA